MEDKRPHRETRVDHRECRGNRLRPMEPRVQRIAQRFDEMRSGMVASVRQRCEETVDVLTGMPSARERVRQDLRDHLVVLTCMIVDRLHSRASELRRRRNGHAHCRQRNRLDDLVVHRSRRLHQLNRGTLLAAWEMHDFGRRIVRHGVRVLQRTGGRIGRMVG
jgi:hypothetical protein